MPVTVRAIQVTELAPAVHAGVRAAHLRATYADDAVQKALVEAIGHHGLPEPEAGRTGISRSGVAYRSWHAREVLGRA